VKALQRVSFQRKNIAMNVTNIFRKNSFVLAFVFYGCLLGCGSSAREAGAHDSGPPPATARLVINEVQPKNKTTITDEHGDTSDWIEIYNAGTAAVDLKGFSLSDSKTPSPITGSVPLGAGAYVLLWADGKSTRGPNHLTFKLGGTKGDSVTISDPFGNDLDEVSFGVDAGEDFSYARFPNLTGAFAWCGTPTPGLPNGSGCGVP
jgi:hypothetical protein